MKSSRQKKGSRKRELDKTVPKATHSLTSLSFSEIHCALSSCDSRFQGRSSVKQLATNTSSNGHSAGRKAIEGHTRETIDIKVSFKNIWKILEYETIIMFMRSASLKFCPSSDILNTRSSKQNLLISQR
ncbi:Protein CBG27662 [Caenorhabditis briggsae]|uniref:Protein CBG27662 n=1 Tax=Caenorhabditis briggsae TaxID=6238 RepID=B6IJA7_CAEBR|nr:Protein CBG27662 [Caenorhabditis briggsae]CAR99941.1 Protein CBG27662 [Caenorhabditis briggsae]